MGVAYEGETAFAGALRGTEQIWSMKLLNSAFDEPMKIFIGSIHGSLLPKVVMFARPCNDLAISVKVRRALALGCSGTHIIS